MFKDILVHELVKCGRPEAIAIVDKGRHITYAELSWEVEHFRRCLYARGVRLGDRVGLFARNSAEYIYAYFGIAALGAIVVPINFQLSSREVAYILKDAGIKLLLTDKELYLDEALAAIDYIEPVQQWDIYAAAKAQLPGYNRDETELNGSACGKAAIKCSGVYFASANGENTVNGSEIEVPSLPSDFSPNDRCVIVYTSGTTGNPKGAILTHHNLVFNCYQIRRLKCNPDCSVLCVLPMYHCFGWTLSVLNTLYCGAKIVILDSFAPKETVQTIRDEGITDMYVVPAICSVLTKTADREAMKNLRLVVSGGATLPMAVQTAFVVKFGIEICEGYGLSEASPVVAVNPMERVKTGSIGILISDLEARIVDEQGNDVPAGEPGELVVRGGNVMQGYWNLPEATAKALKDGWLYTGDVARMDAEGYVYIVDRIKDMIISMGENVYPREIEELVHLFDGVNECAVIGVPDKIRGQAGACFYTVTEGAKVNKRELKKYLQKNLAPFKVPRNFVEIAVMPRTTTGKIAKRQLNLPE